MLLSLTCQLQCIEDAKEKAKADKAAKNKAIKLAAAKKKGDIAEQKAKEEEQKEKLYADFREEDRINMALIEKEAHHEAISEGKAADLRKSGKQAIGS